MKRLFAILITLTLTLQPFQWENAAAFCYVTEEIDKSRSNYTCVCPKPKGVPGTKACANQKVQYQPHTVTDEYSFEDEVAGRTGRDGTHSYSGTVKMTWDCKQPLSFWAIVGCLAAVTGASACPALAASGCSTSTILSMGTSCLAAIVACTASYSSLALCMPCSIYNCTVDLNSQTDHKGIISYATGNACPRS